MSERLKDELRAEAERVAQMAKETQAMAVGEWADAPKLADDDPILADQLREDCAKARAEADELRAALRRAQDQREEARERADFYRAEAESLKSTVLALKHERIAAPGLPVIGQSRRRMADRSDPAEVAVLLRDQTALLERICYAVEATLELSRRDPMAVLHEAMTQANPKRGNRHRPEPAADDPYFGPGD